jgi:hypothetical protein
LSAVTPASFHGSGTPRRASLGRAVFAFPLSATLQPALYRPEAERVKPEEFSMPVGRILANGSNGREKKNLKKKLKFDLKSSDKHKAYAMN